MEIICDYSDYLSILQSGKTSCVFGGETSVLNVVLYEGENLPIGQFYVWDTLCDSGAVALLKVEYNGDSLRIIEGILMENALMDITRGFGINNLDVAMRWWNLCYFRDKGGKVKYDSYYEIFYAANEIEIKLPDLHKALEIWIEESFVGVEGLIYVLDDLANCNPIIYLLQQRGLDVKTISIEQSDSVSNYNKRMLQLRQQLSVPYSGTDVVKVSFFTSDSVGSSLAECRLSYLITIPIDVISINDNAIGSFSYKDILPNEEFCCDYSCCGHDYSYVEMELFADLHGNTTLKTTNSKAESKYSIINMFNYTNLQKYGESNQ